MLTNTDQNASFSFRRVSLNTAVQGQAQGVGSRGFQRGDGLPVEHAERGLIEPEKCCEHGDVHYDSTDEAEDGPVRPKTMRPTKETKAKMTASGRHQLAGTRMP